MNKFNRYNLEEDIIKALDTLGYTDPTEVQVQAIEPILNGEDVLIKSQTGSGKTAAFGIPLMNHTKWEIRTPQTLVLTPTRELALQVRDELKNIGKYKRLNTLAIYGKDSFKLQIRDLAQRTHIIVATPGRLIDHIEQETINLESIQTLVIDEADEMLSMGFIDQIEEIISSIPQKIQIVLLSATYPDGIKELAQDILKDPVEINVESTNKVNLRIIQESYIVDKDHKLELLKDLIIVKNPDYGIIFANTKEAVDTITNYLEDMNVSVNKLHGDIYQKERTQTIHTFKTGQFRYLVATDVASRGLDIEDVDLIINFDTPHQLETYTHRIGRTARLDKDGYALSLLDKDDVYWIEASGILETYDILPMKYPSASLVDARYKAFYNKQARKPKPRKLQEAAFDQEIMQLHIKAGKNQKMRPGDVVGVLTSIPGIAAEDIGVIQVLEDSTYVQIHNNKGDKVIKYLKTTPIKGKLRRVQKAKNKPIR